MRFFTTLTLLGALVVSAAVCAETYYKWQDERGSWHYSTSPPPENVASSEVSIDSGTVTPSAQNMNSGSSGQSAAQTEADKTAAEKKQRDEYCASAKRNVDILEDNSVVTTDTSGNENAKALTPEQHASALEKARAMVTLYCSPSDS
jgi:hypothetical protein